MRRIGVLTSGGDAPGMNAALRAVVRTALIYDLEIIGVRWGYRGLIKGDFSPLDRRCVSNIIHQGGTILGTARSREFETKKGRAQALAAVCQAGLEGLVLIGGEGTFHGGDLLMKEGDFPVVGVPGTIDNDCYGTDYTIGFDTAVNTALEAIDRIRDTATSHNRLFFVEVMGRHTGFIALESGIAGGAEEVLIPEDPIGIDELCRRLQTSFRGGKKSSIVVVAETGQPGDSFRIAREVKERIGLDSRVCVLGHIQRGGVPTARDRVLASHLGAAAVEALKDGRWGFMVGECRGEITHVPLRDTWRKKKLPPPSFEALARLLSG